VNAAVSPVLEAALDAARQLATQPPGALRQTKALLRSEEPTVAGRMAVEMDQFGRALVGEEFAEVMAARSEGRPPVFTR
jgi:enoyl-CoA hydratase/carnithine racemase